MNIKESKDHNLCKVFGTKSKYILSSLINKNKKPFRLTGEVKPVSFVKKKKLPRYKVFLKKPSETSVEKSALSESKETIEVDNADIDNYQSSITHIKSTAKALIEAAEQLCLPKELKTPSETGFTAPPYRNIFRSPGLEKLKDSWFFIDSEDQSADTQDSLNLKEKSSHQLPKLDLLKTDDQEETMSLHQQILKTMTTPIAVTKEDILNLKDAFVKVVPKTSEKEKSPVSPEKSEPGALKKMKADIALKSSKIKQSSKITHHHFCGVTNEFQIPSPLQKATWRYHTPSKYQTHFPIKSCRESIATNHLPDEGETTLTAGIMIECDFKNDLNELESKAEELLCELQMTIEGNEVPTMVDDDMYFWTLSPPKLNISAKHVKRLMFPLYQQSEASDVLRYRKIDKSQQFLPSFNLLSQKEMQKRYLESLSGFENFASTYSTSSLFSETIGDKDSAAKESSLDEEKLTLDQKQKGVEEKLSAIQMLQPKTRKGSLTTEDVFTILRATTEREERGKFLSPYDTYSVESSISSKEPWEESDSEESTPVSSAESETLLDSPITLETTLSADNIYNVEKMSRLHPLMIESEPTYFDIESLAKQKGKPSDVDIDEWIKEIWNIWSSELSPDAIKEHVDIFEGIQLNHLLQCTFSPKTAANISFDDFLKSAINIEFNISDYQTVMEEIEYLGKKIIHYVPPYTDDIFKRGILYLKTGDFEASLEDLNRVIKEDPKYMNAYWHRHLIYIFKGFYLLALDDLNVLMQEWKSYELYMALGLVYAKLEQPTHAIENFTRAIERNLSDDLAYLYRAQLYQMGGYIQEALNDYSSVLELNPLNSVIILKHATLSMRIRRWAMALVDFDKLIKMSLNSNYVLQRAKIYIELKKFHLALRDLCDAIHLDPDLWEAYFLRGYLLKRSNEKQALSDFSISLLLNDKLQNVSCYYQRAVLYVKLGCVHQAISDFLCVLSFHPNSVNVLLCLAHVYSNYIQNYKKALMYCTNVIELEPTGTRGYFVRANTYERLEQYTDALRDYITIIHLKPTDCKAYLNLGYINLKLDKFDLSQTFLSLACERNTETGVGLTPEMAMVQLFLGDVSLSLDILKYNIAKDPCSIPLLQMLAKVQVADFRHREALQTYFLMMDIMKPEKKVWPEGADDLFYNIGCVHMKIQEYEEAYVALNQALKINRKHRDAFYYRGIVKIHLNMCDFIHDFNKSLAANRQNAQVFLSRACYFGLMKNYPKAILNCNEALQLEPQNIKGLLYRGALKYFIAAYKFAIMDLTEAIKLNANVAVTYLNRGICYAASGKKAKALRDYSIALLIGSKMDYKTYVNRGLLYYSLNDISNAFNDFKCAIKIYGGDHKVYHILGLILHRQEKLDVALKVFTRCIILQPTFQEAFISRANVYMDFLTDANNQLARFDYQRALKLNPTNCLAYVSLGIFLQVERNFSLAWNQFTNALLIDPQYQPAYEARAILNLQMGNKYPAFQDLTIALQIGPTAELFNNRGVVNQMMNSPATALHDYYKAIETDRTFALAYFNAGSLHLQGRFFKQALVYFNRAIMLDKENECAYINRAITKVMLNDNEGASADFEMAIELCPYYTHTFYNRGSFYLSLKMYEMAEKDFTSALKIYPSDVSTLLRRAQTRRAMGKYNLALIDYKYAIMLMTHKKKTLTDS